ncbi:MAG TPA: LysM peptidoglycan-binding domain-containing protein [Gemmatimonadales bacterium]|nr:LysM peptidoglycan-binding domain-containing protein [Gemmatimonadales bacterium]
MSRTPRSELLRSLGRWPLSLATGVLLALAPGALRAQVPETHTVKAGDTLWDLAKQYLGDPFLWPDIYRLNTLVVEDPHWIYPGEVLRIAPSEKATAVPQAEAQPPVAAVAPPPSAAPPIPTPAAGADTTAVAQPAPEPSEVRPGLAEVPAEQQAPAQPEPSAEQLADTTRHLFPPSRGLVTPEVLVADRASMLHPLHRADFYSSGFLTEDDPLPFGLVHGPVTPSDIPTSEPRSATSLYTKIAIDPPSGAAYQVGDTLLVANARASLEGYGRVVEPRGLARVVQISEGAAIAEVVAVYGEILPGQSSLPAEKFTDPGVVKPVPVSQGVAADVIGWPGRHELKGSGIVVFLDKGKRDGVAPGDIFEVHRTPGRHSDRSITIAEVMATLQVVHVRDRSATTRVLGVASPNIPRGSHAIQVAKLPS